MPPSSTRRQFLRSATALSVGTTIAGCSQTSTSNTTTTETTTSETTTDSRTTASRTTTDSRTVVDITQESYLAKAWTLPGDRFQPPKGDSVLLSELDESVRDAVRTAIDSPPFTTRDASQELLDGIDDIDLISYKETVWNIEHTFPTVTIRLDTDIPEDEPATERTVSHDADVIRSNESIEDVVSTIAPLGVETAPRPFETTRLEPDVQDFLDRYDYIETPRGVGEIVVSRTNRTPPHTVRAKEVRDEELYGHRIREADDYGSPTREFIDRVLASDRKTPGNHQERTRVLYPDDVPWQFSRDLDYGSNYVRVDDEVFGFDTRHIHWHELPIEFEASVTSENAERTSPVDIQLSVQNTHDNLVRLMMSGVAPFGVLWAYGPGGEHVLWNEEYEQTDDVVIENGNVIPEFRAEMDLRSGQTQSETYRLGHDHLRDGVALQPGSYEVLGTIWAKWPTYKGAEEYDWRNQLFPYTLTIEVV